MVNKILTGGPVFCWPPRRVDRSTELLTCCGGPASLKIRQDTHKTSEREAVKSIVSTGRESRAARVRCNALFTTTSCGDEEGKAE